MVATRSTKKILENDEVDQENQKHVTHIEQGGFRFLLCFEVEGWHPCSKMRILLFHGTALCHLGLFPTTATHRPPKSLFMAQKKGGFWTDCWVISYCSFGALSIYIYMPAKSLNPPKRKPPHPKKTPEKKVTKVCPNPIFAAGPRPFAFFAGGLHKLSARDGCGSHHLACNGAKECFSSQRERNILKNPIPRQTWGILQLFLSHGLSVSVCVKSEAHGPLGRMMSLQKHVLSAVRAIFRGNRPDPPKKDGFQKVFTIEPHKDKYSWKQNLANSNTRNETSWREISGQNGPHSAGKRHFRHSWAIIPICGLTTHFLKKWKSPRFSSPKATSWHPKEFSPAKVCHGDFPDNIL